MPNYGPTGLAYLFLGSNRNLEDQPEDAVEELAQKNAGPANADGVITPDTLDYDASPCHKADPGTYFEDGCQVGGD
jgi:hypothetical protein